MSTQQYSDADTAILGLCSLTARAGCRVEHVHGAVPTHRHVLQHSAISMRKRSPARAVVCKRACSPAPRPRHTQLWRPASASSAHTNSTSRRCHINAPAGAAAGVRGGGGGGGHRHGSHTRIIELRVLTASGQDNAFVVCIVASGDAIVDAEVTSVVAAELSPTCALEVRQCVQPPTLAAIEHWVARCRSYTHAAECRW